MTSQPRKQTIAIHMLPNISKSKGNQTMKFGQLIEYNMGNVLLENVYTESEGQLFLDLLSKKWSISLDQKILDFTIPLGRTYNNNNNIFLKHLKGYSGPKTFWNE